MEENTNPLIHLNGDSASRIEEDYMKVFSSLQDTMDVIRKAESLYNARNSANQDHAQRMRDFNLNNLSQLESMFLKYCEDAEKSL